MFTLAKEFFSKYLITALLALVVVGAASTFYYKVSYSNARDAYSQHLAADEAAAKLLLAQQTFNENAARKSADDQVREHQKVQARLALDNDNLKKKIGDLYASKTNATFRLDSYRDLQLLQAASGGIPDAHTAGDPEQLTSCRGQLNAIDSRLSTVEEACAVTTSDFNLARGWIDSVCAVHECKDKK